MKLFSLLCATTIIFASSNISPLPKAIPVDPEKVRLGKALFFDPILSKDNTVSCATCHQLENGGDDNLPFSFGIDGQQGNMNTPTVLNAVFNFAQFWNGRAGSLAEQAKGPIVNPVEMGNTFQNVVETLNKSSYRDSFEAIYVDGITPDNIADAIAEYEKTLITPDSPFDRYISGEEDAISENAKEGYRLFKQKGCISCHHGVNIGGNHYSKFGLLEDVKSQSLGRFEVTGNEEDRYYFKVPSLRNVTETAPYFHDGRTVSLVEAVKLMALLQLGRQMSDDEIQKIVAFLNTLSGRLPEGATE